MAKKVNATNFWNIILPILVLIVLLVFLFVIFTTPDAMLFSDELGPTAVIRNVAKTLE